MQDGIGGGSAIELWLAEADHPRRDTELQRKVWEEFRWEPGLEPSAIAVLVADGVATLSGSVRSYLEKVLALRAVQQVPGIQSAVDELVVELPATSERSDAELSDEVRRMLDWNLLVPRERVRATVLKGWVRLEGEVDLDCQRTAAEQQVERLVGVKGMTNLIRVGATPAGGPLKDRVGEALRRVGPSAKHVKVQTHGGTVVLHGHVRSLAERSEVERAVRAVPGVGEVRSELRI